MVLGSCACDPGPLGLARSPSKLFLRLATVSEKMSSVVMIKLAWSDCVSSGAVEHACTCGAGDGTALGMAGVSVKCSETWRGGIMSGADR